SCGSENLRELAATYRALRAQRQEHPDLRSPELTDWNGQMHRVMTDLGTQLAAEHASSRCVEHLLGPPDEVRSTREGHADVVVGRGEQHLLYWWRGGHDYLYLVVRAGRVSDARWWFAYE